MMRTCGLLLSAIVLGLSLGAHPVKAKPEPVAADRSATPRIDYETYRLPNGLQVILSEDHRLPLVAVNLWYHVGPANERAGRTGFAHLFEHMMFQGSAHVPRNAHIGLLEGAGATDLNGTTDFDRTNYFETVPSNELELALWLESDRMGYLLDTLDQSKLTNQKDVVRNERRQSIENRPYGLADEELYHQLFQVGHPYHADVMGSHADIESARLADVRAFFRQYYVPNNASLAIVGDIDRAHTKALVEKYFGSLPAGAPVPRVTVQTPPITSEHRVVVHDNVQLPRIYLGWLSAPIYKPGDAEADVLGEILGGGKSSRLYQHLVYERQIAQDVTANQQSLVLGSVFSIVATARPGVSPETLERAIEEEVATIAHTPPTVAEVDRARNTIDAQIIRGLETLGGFGGVADRLNQYNHYLGNPGFLGEDLERYRRVTPQSVQKVAATLTPNSRVVVYALPGERVLHDVPKTAEAAEPSGAGAGAQGANDSAHASASASPASWREKRPEPGPASHLSLPTPERFVLSNGLTVLLLPQHRLPVVSASLVVLSGSEANPASKPGLASFTADMLDEGTARRTAPQIAADVAQIGAELSTGSSSDATFVELRALKQSIEPAFDLLSDVVLHPAFAPAEVERVRGMRLTQFQQQQDSPRTIAVRALDTAIYGPAHPYGFTELGTRASLQSISREDLQQFWQRGYTPKNAALVVAGDLNATELRALAEKYFGPWSGAANVATLPPVQPAGERRILIVDHGASPQTALRLGQLGPPRATPDYASLEVMNTALGGIFSSRINLNLRERHGYTYGAASAFAFRRGPGPFVVATGVRTDVTAPAVREIFNELGRIRSEPLSPEELDLARDSVARSLPGLFETTPEAARSIGQLFVYTLPLDYYATLPGRIEGVSSADVQRVAQHYIDPDRMIVVAVGDRARIEPELQKLKLGPVQVTAVD